jgi:ATP-binding cassette subfamily F protein 3
MLLAALNSVDKFYGGQTVLEGANLELHSGTNTAVIGRNGVGKTTILRLLSGAEVPDGGSVFLREDTSFGLLRQETGVPSNATLQEFVEGSFKDLTDLGRTLAELESAGLDDPSRYEEWELIHGRFKRRGGYERRARQDAVLHALGFRGREDGVVSQLSGGERTRLDLAQLLMKQPELLLLDEPTNHLDIEMRDWLEKHLKRYPGCALVISHDRTFLDKICDRTAEVSRGGIRVAKGNPTACRDFWGRQFRVQQVTRRNQEKEQARLSAASIRMRRWARQNEKLHRRARSMERRLERHENMMINVPEGPVRSTRFGFPCGPSGEMVIQAEHLSKGYASPLFQDVNTVVRSQERIALVGPNGAGKSTLLRVLLGEVNSDDPRGRVRFGARVRVGLYDQTLRNVNPKATLVEELVRLVGDVKAHNLLGRFMFPYEAQYKRIADLSGGERARLALLRLTLSESNLLILDEPTNHLDVEMIEALEDALRNFTGTLLIVSHDRQFIERVSTKIWELRNGKLSVLDGDWAYYQRRSQIDSCEPRSETRDLVRVGPAVRSGSTRSKWQLQQEVRRLEEKITLLERSLEKLNQVLAYPQKIDPKRIGDLGREYRDVEEALFEAMSAWEACSSELADQD